MIKEVDNNHAYAIPKKYDNDKNTRTNLLISLSKAAYSKWIDLILCN